MRYLLFGGESYYARGGINDLLGTFDEPEKAWRAGIESLIQIPGRYNDWWHVFDAHTGKIIFRSEDQAYGAGNKVEGEVKP